MFVLCRSIVALALLCFVSSVAAHPTRLGVNHRHLRARSTNTQRCKSRLPPSSVLASASAHALAPVSTPGVSTQPASSTHASSTHASTSAHPTSHTSSPSPSTHAASPSPTAKSSASTDVGFSVYEPVSPVSSNLAWSTAPDAPDPLPLDDATFQVFKVLSALKHPYVNAPDGQLSMQATYPQGSWNFEGSPLGGFSFYAPGPDTVDLTTAKEATFGYSVYFEEGFEWNLGGKLPGLCAFS